MCRGGEATLARKTAGRLVEEHEPIPNLMLVGRVPERAMRLEASASQELDTHLGATWHGSSDVSLQRRTGHANDTTRPVLAVS